MIDVDKGYVPGLVDNEGNIIVAQPNAGVIHRYTPEGISVYMYNSEPGRYYSEQGHELPEGFAKLAGFDTEDLARKRRKSEAMSQAASAIEAEFAASTKRVVVETRGEYSLVEIGDNRFNIEFDDGTAMNPMPLPKDVAIRLLDTLAPKGPATPAKK